VRVADYHLRDVIACPHILALANSRAAGTGRALSDMQADHLRAGPALVVPVPGDDSALQAFHRDSEDWRYLKVLVYLTDVDDGAGPHVYLHGSHLTQAPMRLRFYSDVKSPARTAPTAADRHRHARLLLCGGHRRHPQGHGAVAATAPDAADPVLAAAQLCLPLHAGAAITDRWCWTRMSIG
jgi:hypothetical protein